MISDGVFASALSRTLYETNFLELGQLYRGKVRDSYLAPGIRTLVATDRISAFDRLLGTIPFKGQVLNQLTAFWFEKTKHLVPNHLINSPDPSVSVAKECVVFPVEFVVRAYLTGSAQTSIWVNYQKGAREYCGHKLPDGLRKHHRFTEPLITPTTKAPKGQHDQLISRADAIASGAISAADFDQISKLALELFRFGSDYAAQQGLILVDTKYEFGRTADGEIIVVDEIHTPDSSRYWHLDSYEPAMQAGQDPKALDKEFVRIFLVEQGFTGEGPVPSLPNEIRIEAARRYVQTFEKITSRSFVPNTEDPTTRIRRNLQLA